MQKNTIVWLMASYFVLTYPLIEATAATFPTQSDPELLSDAPAGDNATELLIQQGIDRNPYEQALDFGDELPGQQLDAALTRKSPWFSEESLLASQSASPVPSWSASPSANLSTTLSDNSRQLIRTIRNASVHGLNPDNYGLSQIMIAIDALSAMDLPVPLSDRLQGTVPQPDSDRLRQSFSASMDLAFARLATHLGEGVVNARKTQRGLFRDAPQINAEHLLASVWNDQQTVMEALDSVAPVQAEYQRLTNRMRDLLTERAAGIERPVIRSNDILSASMNHTDVMVIKHRLMETGELPPNTALTPRFDTELVAAVRQFQQRQGLEPDGAVGRLTRQALNFSIDDEIRALALSLERWRWMPRDLGEKHLYINIPDYRVIFRDGIDTKMSMVAVVGAVEHQTPTFSRDMSYMEFNPTWTVPSSIANKELIPKERRHPGYLKSRGFYFLESVNNQLVPVPPERVTSGDLHSNPFPYTLRQRAGSMNDLGRIKFMMPNRYAIYLHDTPAKSHFTLNERAYSHGCIRLSDPDQLATLLMTEDNYSSGAIRRALQAPKTHRIRLRDQIPTHLTYMTTWVDDAGILQRRPDIYRHDAALLTALQSSDTLLSTLNSPTASFIDPTLPLRGKI